MSEKQIKLRIPGQGGDQEVTAFVDDDNPVGASKYKARINGVNIYFDSQADLFKADQMIRSYMGNGDEDAVPELGRGGGYGGGGGGGNGGSGDDGAGALRTGAHVAQTVGAFLAGRGLRNKRDDLVRSMKEFDIARSELDSLQGKYSELVPVLGRIFDRMRDEQTASLGIIDDELLALDVAAGTGLALVMDDFWSGKSNRRGGNYNNALPALAVGGLGLGIGYFLSQRNKGHNH